MRGKRVFLVGGLLSLVVAAGYWIAGSADEGLVPSGIDVTRGGGQVAAVPRGGKIQHTVVEAEPRTEVATAGVTIAGRCVDAESGEPVSGIRVTLSATPPPLRDGTPIVPLDVPQPEVTGPGGRFEFAFPATDWACALELDGAGIIPMYSEFAELAGDNDCGDIEVTRGCLVRGRLRDDLGNPLPGREVRIGGELVRGDLGGQDTKLGGDSRRRTIAFVPRSRNSADTAADGSFELGPLVSGLWGLRLRGHRGLSEGSELELFAGETTRWIDLVAEPVTEVITGRLEGGGVPVQGAKLLVSLPGSRVWSQDVAEDGTFTIERLTGEPGGFATISATARFHHRATRTHAWGESDIRIVLRAKPLLPIRVTAAATGNPVQGFGVRAIPLPVSGPGQTSLRQAGQQWNGEVTFAGMEFGPHLIMVEPIPRATATLRYVRFYSQGQPVEQTLASSWFVPVELREHNETLHIELERFARRQVIVQGPLGEPVDDARVQLVRSIDGAPVVWTTPLVTREKMQGFELTKAFLLQEAKTDARGRLTLGASPGEEYAVRVFVRSRAPVVVNDFEVADDLPPVRIVIN